jgi:amino acid permease
MSRKKAIIILVLSITIDLLYILFHLWNLGVFGETDAITVILENGQTVTTEKATSGLGYGIMNMLLTAGVVLSWIGIFVSSKNLRKSDKQN